MKGFVASTGEEGTVRAALAALDRGGNAVDGALAAALAWPPALSSAGALLGRGAGMGQAACRFAARSPGLGLSRPRRVRLFAAAAPAALAATPSGARLFAAASSRWGTLGLPALVKACVAGAGEVPHAEALSHLADAGAAGAVKGPWALAAARALGPLAGGLLTRRDLIEARADLDAGTVSDPWLSTSPLVGGAASASAAARGRRRLSVVVTDGRGAVAAVALDAGSPVDAAPEVMGVPANTLLRGLPSSTARRVGRPIPLLVGVAATGGGDGAPPLVLCGPLGPLAREVGRHDAASWDLADVPEVLLALRAGRPPLVRGAASQGEP